ncbi:MAG: tetratricopeptide repeat protein [Gammaproteobacteria bacterium]|nr:tetratricopeptide repeat protein [Gammaproteobacteria bacterium]
MTSNSPPPIATAAAQLRELHEQSRFEEAEQLARALMQQYPREPFFPNALGNIQKQLQDIDGAAESYDAALQIDPDFQAAWVNAGHIAIVRLQYARALECFEKARELQPDSPDAWFGQARAQQLCGDTAAAERDYRKALELKPDLELAWNNLGCLYQDTLQLQESEDCLRRALALKPDHPEALLNLAVTLGRRGNYLGAELSCREALALNPDNYSNHNNLGKILADCGRLEEALSCYLTAMQLAPDKLSVHSNMLFTLHYLSDGNPEELYQEARHFGAAAARQADHVYDSWPAAVNGPRLRVGFVSGDLINHPVGYFLESVVRHLDPERIELLAFPTRSRTDELTERLRPYFSAWHPLTALEDAEAATLIRDCGVHILVDLSGHTGHNRLPLFARKPAPVQVSWLGYFASTGLDAMDYVLTDPTGVPPGKQRYFCERIEYLPKTRLCFTPPDVDLVPNALPALSNGRLTFACFQKLSKITDAVIALWAAVMTALPHSRLLLQTQALNDRTVADALGARLQKAGIARDRFRLLGVVGRNTYLQQYHAIDFLLDTFPYPGGTTTSEALWMGVPTLTLAGDSMLARQGASLLEAAGLSDWIAWSPEAYVKKAIDFGTNLPALAGLRSRLRNQLLESPLCDAPHFARDLEKAFFRMWERHPQGHH